MRAGLDALAARPEIDPQRLGCAGVCLGVGYAFWAAVDNPMVKAVGGVAGYYRNPAAMRAGDREGFDAKVAQGRAARVRYEETGEVVTVPAAALGGDAAMTLADTYDYYATPRAGVANYTNAFAVMSREHFLPFDVQSAAPRLTAPVRMVHSENALSPVWARKFFDAITAPKDMRWIASKGQTDIYDDPAIVAQACDLLAEHLHAHLG